MVITHHLFITIFICLCIKTIIKGQIPKEFANIALQVLKSGKYANKTIGQIIDYHPYYLIQQQYVLGLKSDFIKYLQAVQRVRINFYCPFKQSWRAFYKRFQESIEIEPKNTR